MLTLTSKGIPSFSSKPDNSLYRWMRQSLPPFLVEIDLPDGSAKSFSTYLLDEGWRGLLLERNGALPSHLHDNWKSYFEIKCIQFDAYQLEALHPNSQSLARILLENEVPAEFGILILNGAETRIQLLREFERNGFRPWLIALKDEGEAAAQRYPAYAFLAEKGYRFAGIEHDRSLWTRADSIVQTPSENRSTVPGVLHEELGRSCFDVPTGTGTLDATGHIDLAVGGWAFLDETRPVPPSVFLEVEDLRTRTVEYSPAGRYPRVDVASHFGNSDLLMSGFYATVSMRGLHPNGLRLRVIQCDQGKCYSSLPELRLERGMQEFEHAARRGLAQKFLRGSGIEIGALQRRLELSSNCSVRYVDRMTMTDLLRHYPELDGLPLQHPDLVDDGEYLDSIAASSLDFVVANHFFEHSENPIKTLKNMFRVLKPQGILFMAVPDKRYTFDAQRPSTSLTVLKETYHLGRRPNRSQLYREWVEFVEMKKEPGINERVEELLRDKYSIHFNVWSADELFTFLTCARQEFSLSFTITSAVCCDNEVIVLLEKEAFTC